MKKNSNKLWAKSQKEHLGIIEKFTIGRDVEFDMELVEFDIIGTKAHIKMLHKIGFIEKDELVSLEIELNKMLELAKNENFSIEEGVEDVHSQIEINLVEALGDIGKKIHTGRSRNDQVLLALKLYFRNEIIEIAKLCKELFGVLLDLSEKYKKVLMPGYTHYQVGMPSSFGLWFSAFAESIVEDLELLNVALSVSSKNPLGSGAGYGSSFPLDRDFTTKELGLEKMNINSIYAQMTRGKTEKILAFAMSSISATVGKLANDVCLYINQNFGFISFPDEFTTGSSIMPHKKNPDIFELIRAKCSRIQAVPNELALLMNNLMTGYNRDYQLTKEIIFPTIKDLKHSIEILNFILPSIKVSEDILKDEKYKYIFSVEKINELVIEGRTFRDAYKEVGISIESDTYNYYKEELQHTHKGSVGNLCLEEIRQNFNEVYDKFKINENFR